MEQPHPPHPRDCDGTQCDYPRCRRRLTQLYNNHGDVGGGWLSTRIRRLRVQHVRRYTQHLAQPINYDDEEEEEEEDYEPNVVDYRWLITMTQPGQPDHHIPTPIHPEAPPIPDLVVEDGTTPPWVRRLRLPPRIHTPPVQHPEPDQSLPMFTHLRPQPTRPQHIPLTAMEVGQRPLGPTPECRVCLTALADIAFLPCHHVVCCGTCTRRLENQRCPVCRQDVARAFRVYF